MNHFIKIFFAIFSICCWAENSPSFSYSQEQGLKQISDEKNNASKILNTTSKNEIQDPIQEKKSKATPIVNSHKQGSTTKTQEAFEQLTQKTTKQQTVENSVSQNPENQTELNTQTATKDSISESFAPQNPKAKTGTDIFDTLFENVSWIFQKKESKHKIALVPIYSYNKTENSRLGLRFFSFSSEKNGHFFALSGAKYFPKNYYSSILSYNSHRKSVIRSTFKFMYDSHYENYYGKLKSFEGLNASLDEITQLEAHRLIIDYDIYYQEKETDFYLGVGAKVLIRQNTQSSNRDKESDFPSEYFLFLRAFTGWDTRDNWKYPKQGVFHQISFGCKASLVYPDAYCQGQGDFRFYLSLLKTSTLPQNLKDTVFALRAFYGSSFISESSYSTKYSLGGVNFFQNFSGLRAFKSRRFLGDKMYTAQSEVRVPLWKEYLIGSVFFELGETVQFQEPFKNYLFNYGAGLRIGWPGDTGMKMRLDYSTGKDLQNKSNADFIISFLQAF